MVGTAGEEQLSSCRSAPEPLPEVLSSQQGRGEGEQPGWSTISVAEQDQCGWNRISAGSVGAARTEPQPGELGSCSHFCKANTPKTQELLRHDLANT